MFAEVCVNRKPNDIQRVTSWLVCLVLLLLTSNPTQFFVWVHPHKDSNTRYVLLGGPHVEMRREPTYTIEAIDPHEVAGYQKVWIHMGINSLKRHHCHSMSEVKQKFDIFMRKISEIKSVYR